MTPPALAARDLVKTFTIHTGTAMSLKEIALRGFVTHRKTTTFQALKGISFEVPRGRSLGVVGSNGSGKSTLLKLISGISQPTSGQLEVNGRVAALLELGAGFHPDLTGMENIFLQGSILGLSRREILDRLDDVLDFCELGGFIHTPMKRYSSGMTIRLGFSLAVHSDADILLVDEVLAVGDAAFQAKCLRKIRELRAAGKTILFVSHQVQHVEMVADELLWLEQGTPVAMGSLDEVLPRYLEALTSGEETGALDEDLHPGDPRHQLLMVSRPRGVRMAPRGAAIERVQFLGEEGRPRQMFLSGEPMIVEIAYTVLEPLPSLDVQLGYAGPDGLRLAWHSARVQGLAPDCGTGRHIVRARIDELPFRPGRYRIGVALVKSLRAFEFYDMHVEAYTIQVRGAGADPEQPLVRPPGRFLPRTTE